jgi:hypothetical protein
MSLPILRLVADAFVPLFEERFGSRLKGLMRGLDLRFDDYWYTSTAQMFRERYEWYEQLEQYAVDYHWVVGKEHEIERQRRLRENVSYLFDHHSKPVFRNSPQWDLRCRSKGYPEGSLPITFRVTLREQENEKLFAELPRSFEQFPVVYEVRPPAVGLSAGPSVKASGDIGRSSPPVSGTVGGFLRDQVSKQNYLLSCAHVLGNIGDHVTSPGGSSSGLQVGIVVHSILPSLQTNPGSCSSKSHPTIPYHLDLAIAELDPVVVPDPHVNGIGIPSSITPFISMKQGDQVSLVGKASGRVDAEIDALTVFHEIDIDNQPRCFGNVCRLCPPKPWYLNTKLVKRGDSGSWVLRSANSMIGWDGILFAGDGASAFSCYAEDVFNDVTQKVSGNLTIFP